MEQKRETSSHAGARWLVAMRLRTLPLTLACIALGAFLAAADGGWRWPVAGLALLTALLLQILSNLANDYGDSIHGADQGQRIGPARMVSSGQITPQAMRRAIALTTLLTLAAGLALIGTAVGVERLPLALLFVVLGGVAVWAAVRYTVGHRPYGYVGLGDLFVFLFFGWVGVAGTYFLQTLVWRGAVLLPAASCGLFAVAVLNLNNMRDRHSDAAAGKRSLPVRLGLRGARLYHTALLLGGIWTALLYVLLQGAPPEGFLFLVIAPLLYRQAAAVWLRPPTELDPLLRQMALTNLLFVLTFGLGQLWAAG